MSKTCLNLVYRVMNEGDSASPVEASWIFSENGRPGEAVVEQAYEPWRRGEEDGLRFGTLEELGEFALRVCELEGHERVYVLSNTDYNIGIETAQNARDFVEIFARHGRVVENPENERKKTSIFNKLFN